MNPSKTKDELKVNYAEMNVDINVEKLGSAIEDLATKLEKPVQQAKSIQKVWDKMNSEPWSYVVLGVGVLGGIIAFRKMRNRNTTSSPRNYHY